MSARPRTKNYGALTLFLQLHYQIDYLRTVPRTVFLPQPDVDSAFVRISPRASTDELITNPQTFTRLVRLGFSQRRKQLQNLLRDEIADWDEAARLFGFDRRARAEELRLEQWAELANLADLATAAESPQDPNEHLAVVDEQDQVLGSASRAEVHGNNLRHRAVHIFVFNHAGELFLQKRSRWKDRHPLLWDSSAAGHVGAGEDYDSTARRELDEELGVTAPLDRKVKLPASRQTGDEFIWIYQTIHDGPFRMPGSEIESGGFFPTGLISAWLEARPNEFAPGFVACWQALQALQSGKNPL